MLTTEHRIALSDRHWKTEVANCGYTGCVGAKAHEAPTRRSGRLAIELPGFQGHRHQSGSDSGRYQRQPTTIAPKSPPVKTKVQSRHEDIRLLPPESSL